MFYIPKSTVQWLGSKNWPFVHCGASGESLDGIFAQPEATARAVPIAVLAALLATRWVLAMTKKIEDLWVVKRAGNPNGIGF